MKMDSAENGRWIIPFKKFGRLRVKNKSNRLLFDAMKGAEKRILIYTFWDGWGMVWVMVEFITKG